MPPEAQETGAAFTSRSDSDTRPKSLCLLRLSALGDVVLVLPLVRWLQRQLPDTKLTWIVGRPVLPLVSGLAAEGIELVPIDKPRGPIEYLRLGRSLRGRQFDALLCLQASWRSNLLYPFIKAPRKIGYGADRAKDCHRLFVGEMLPPAQPHLVDGFFQFAAALGLPTPAPHEIEWKLPIDPSAAAWAKQNLPSTPFAAISACASKPERDWPVENMVEVIKTIRARYSLPIVLLGGRSPREEAMAGRLIEQSGVEIANLVGRTNIPQLVATLSRCRFLLAPDTGAIHIARACDRPTVGLYAVAPTSRTGPYQRTNSCVDVFDEAVRTLQKRDPAHLPWAHRVHDPRAMTLISVPAVLSKIESVLAS